MRMTTRRPCATGFTLIELLLVLAIVGIVTAIAWPSFAAARDRAQRSEARAWLMRLAADQQQPARLDVVEMLGYRGWIEGVRAGRLGGGTSGVGAG